MFQDSEHDYTPGGRRLREENQERWNSRWALFAPPEGVHREAIFHIDIPTMILAAIVGYPLGGMVTESLTGQQAAGGVIGFLVMMMFFGFFRRKLQKLGEGRDSVRSVVPPRPPLQTILRSMLGGAMFIGLLGLWFARSEGDIDYTTAGTRFAALGAVLGFLRGALRAWWGRRRKAN